MNDIVEVSRDVFEPIAMLVREGLFKNEKDALKCLVLDQAASKICQFDFKISEMVYHVVRAVNQLSLELKEIILLQSSDYTLSSLKVQM